jgi:hypothetical protein
MEDYEFSVDFEIPIFDGKWIPSITKPETNTTVLGLWQHWDPVNRMMHGTVHLCEYSEVTPPYREKTDEDAEDDGWHRIDSYKSGKNGLKLRGKRCMAPTFWMDVRYR